jgi:hypothetical protein
MSKTYVYALRSADGQHDHVRSVEFAGTNYTEALVSVLTRARDEWPEATWVAVELARIEE